MVNLNRFHLPVTIQQYGYVHVISRGGNRQRAHNMILSLCLSHKTILLWYCNILYIATFFCHLLYLKSSTLASAEPPHQKVSTYNGNICYKFMSQNSNTWCSGINRIPSYKISLFNGIDPPQSTIYFTRLLVKCLKYFHGKLPKLNLWCLLLLRIPIKAF